MSYDIYDAFSEDERQHYLDDYAEQPQAASTQPGLDWAATNRALARKAAGLLGQSNDSVNSPIWGGLLNMSNALLAAGAPSPTPRSAFDALGAGFAGFNAGYDAQQKENAANQMKALQMLQQLNKPIALAKGGRLIDPMTMQPFGGTPDEPKEYKHTQFYSENGKTFPIMRLEEGGGYFVYRGPGNYEPWEPEGRHSNGTVVTASGANDPTRLLLSPEKFYALQNDRNELQQGMFKLNRLADMILASPQGLEQIKTELITSIRKAAGKPLSDEQIRNALISGEVTKLIGQNRLEFFGPGVLTEKEQAWARDIITGGNIRNAEEAMARLKMLYQDKLNAYELKNQMFAEQVLYRKMNPSYAQSGFDPRDGTLPNYKTVNDRLDENSARVTPEWMDAFVKTAGRRPREGEVVEINKKRYRFANGRLYSLEGK